MDKHAINKFAVQARRDLIAAVTSRLDMLGIDETGAAPADARSTREAEFYRDGGEPLVGKDIGRRQELVKRLKEMAAKSDWATAFHDLIEEVAYTWFNRIIAIRFMEVNDYLPTNTRVLSSSENYSEPDIMRDALDLEEELGGYDPEERALIAKAQDRKQPVDMDAMYRMLFLKQVNKLNESLPKLFEKTDDFMTLLFTPSYNRGVIADLVEQISEADFDIASDDSQGQVEIIGWLYQYYNQEPHNDVVNINGGPVKERDIPAATQLFTTDWVVRYMVDNSLGRYYLEHTPNSKLADHLDYLVPGDLHQVDTPLDLSQLHVLDNAMGSGHILVYAFDVLMHIYEEQGFSRRESAIQIATHNLYGLEIDKRAYQLAYFAVMMKVRQYDRRALTRELKLNLHVFTDSKNLQPELIDQLPLTAEAKAQVKEICDVFRDAKTLGSIMQFPRQYGVPDLLAQLDAHAGVAPANIFASESDLAQLHETVEIVGVLQGKYDAVVTNPPYLNRMDKTLKDYVKKYYKAYSGDLFSVFIWLNINMTRKDGYAGYMTPFVWMFIKTYEALRTDVLDTMTISTLVQMEYSAFEEATVPIDTFVLKNSRELTGTYLKLSDFKGGMQVQGEKVLEAIADPSVKYLYRANQANFGKIPGSPIAYWTSEKVTNLFRHKLLSEVVSPKHGLTTTDNNRFLRRWYEVNPHRILFSAKSRSAASSSGERWFPYNKGGSFRKWYGNFSYIVNFENDGAEIKKNVLKRYPYLKTPDFVVSNQNYYFRQALTWSSLTSGLPSFRYTPAGFVFDTKGSELFAESSVDEEATLHYVEGLLNSAVTRSLLNIISPTMDINPGSISTIPFVSDHQHFSRTITRVRDNQSLSKTDWDTDETSWDFRSNPIAEHQQNWTLEAAFTQWSKEADDRFNQLKANEEELNRIFIDLYGLQDELTPEVADKDVSVRRADRPRDIKAFLSYFIGVVFGRYSLDVPGLAFAGGDWDASKYKTFQPNADNMIVLTDSDYFGDSRDIINRLREFLTVTFGAEYLTENIRFIADSLNKKGDTPEDQIRKYFLDDFYKKDHLSTYQKRPIYWQFDSGKQGGFRALMYLHRYDADTLAMARTSYLHPLQEAYTNRLVQLEKMVEMESSTRQRNLMTKQITQLKKQRDEIAKYDNKLQHVANMHIAIDLDDGVLVNHEKAQGGQKLLSPLK